MTPASSFKEKLQETQAKLFFSKNDPLDPRLGDLFKSTTATNLEPKNSLLIVGYKDDRGIKNSGGREGALVDPPAVL